MAVFLLVSFGLIGGAIAVISGLYEEPGIHYWMEFDQSVSGLYEGSQVSYLGVPIGKVRSIYVTEHEGVARARVDIVTNPQKATLRQGVEAELAIYSLAAGTMVISLDLPKEKKEEGLKKSLPEIPEGSQIPARPSAFAAISEQVEDMMDQMSDILAAVTEGLEGMKSGDLTRIVENVDLLLEDGKGFVADSRELVQTANTTIVDLKDEVEATVGEFKQLSTDVRALTADVKKLVNTTTTKVDQLDVAKTQDRVNEVLENIAAISEQLQKTSAEVDNMSATALHEADNLEHTFRDTAEELREAMGSLQLLMDQLKDDPSSLVRGKATIKVSP